MRFVLCLFALASLSAQTFQATLRGRLTDASGAVVPGAKVTLLDEATGVSRATLSSNEGDFLFNSVVPSTYTVMVQAPGFKATEHKGVAVATQAAVTVDFHHAGRRSHGERQRHRRHPAHRDRQCVDWPSH